MMSELNWDWLKHPAVIWLSKQGNNIYMIREIKCFLNDSLKKQLTQAKKPKKKKSCDSNLHKIKSISAKELQMWFTSPHTFLLLKLHSPNRCAGTTGWLNELQGCAWRPQATIENV